MHDPNPNPGNGETSPRQIADDADANGGDGTKTAFLRQHRRVSVGIASIGGRA
jgi:hypothetical protein